MLQCRENVKIVDILECDKGESLLVKLETHGNVFVVLIVYNPP